MKLYCPVCEKKVESDYWKSLGLGEVVVEHRCPKHHIVLVEKEGIPKSIIELIRNQKSPK